MGLSISPLSVSPFVSSRARGGGGAAPFVGPLDAYASDLAAAYSLRTLLSSWADSDGRLVRVRAFDGANSQGEADCLGVGDALALSLESPLVNLDATALGRGLTEAHTLGDLVDAGGGNYDGLVAAWYDQSGQGRDATQATAGSQPRIVNAGVLEADANGHPRIFGSGVDSGPVLTTSYTPPLEFSVVGVGTRLVQVSGGSSIRPIVSAMPSAINGFAVGVAIASEAGYLWVAGGASTGGTWEYDTAKVFSARFNATDSIMRLNGTQVIARSVPQNVGTEYSLEILGNSGNTARRFHGYAQEVVCYTSLSAGDRAAVETILNDYYEIF